MSKQSRKHELLNITAVSAIIALVAGSLCYGLKHGMIYNLNSQSSFVASHASQHLY